MNIVLFVVFSPNQQPYFQYTAASRARSPIRERREAQDALVQEGVTHRRPGRRRHVPQPAKQLVLHARPLREQVRGDVLPLRLIFITGEVPPAKADAATLHHAKESLLFLG